MWHAIRGSCRSVSFTLDVIEVTQVRALSVSIKKYCIIKKGREGLFC